MEEEEERKVGEGWVEFMLWEDGKERSKSARE